MTRYEAVIKVADSELGANSDPDQIEGSNIMVDAPICGPNTTRLFLGGRVWSYGGWSWAGLPGPGLVPWATK